MSECARSLLSSRPIATLILLWVAVSALASTAVAAPVVGFVETWPGTSVQGWGGGSGFSNPGSGGTGGNGDGYLRFSTPNGGVHNLGVNSFGLEYAGNWTTAGITQVWLWLNDVGADDALEMHFSLGNGGNFWQYNIGFLPPHNAWAEYVVDLSSSVNWTKIIDPPPTETFAQALQSVDRIHVRHDKPPFSQQPDPLDGDVGLDHLLLTNGTTGLPPDGSPVAHPLHLAAPVPNPSRGPVALALEVFDGGPVRVEVVDVAGRLVRRTELAAAASVNRIWTWDGLDASGRPAPAGVYRVRASSPSGGMSRPLVRVN